MAHYKFPKGHKINEGKKASPEIKERQRAATITGGHAFQKGHKMNVGRVCSPETREKISQNNIGKHSSESIKKAISDAGKKKWQDPEYRTMMIEARKGRVYGEHHPMFGKKHTDVSRKKMSESHIGLQIGEKHPMYGRRHSAESIKKMLSISSPNKHESFLMQLIDEMYPREWKFVGNGEVVIAGKCPDFINVNGQKKIIEFYGEHWHHGDDPKDREAVFAPFGYKTLVIWGKELRKIEALTERIRRFCDSPHSGEDAA